MLDVVLEKSRSTITIGCESNPLHITLRMKSPVPDTYMALVISAVRQTKSYDISSLCPQGQLC